MENKKEVKPPSSGIEKVCAPLLPAEAVERIQAKETAQLQAKAERQQKRSEAERLADAVRREELRQIPTANRTSEEQREFRRLEQRRYRAKETKGNVLADVQTAEDFWKANRLLANPQKLHEWKEREERVLDQIFWMNNGWACSPQAADFVSLHEGLADIEAFIAEYGLIHDDSNVYQHCVPQNFRPSWGVWATKTLFDPIWGTVEGFWRDERFNALCSESPASEIYARYGIRIALGAFEVLLFKFCIADHKRSQLLRTWGQHVEHEGEKCWLCNFERLHGVRQP